MEEREGRVKELERKMIELETKKQDVAEERARLGRLQRRSPKLGGVYSFPRVS